jgi:abnormal spindle-like microcephaly-associated protein
VENWTVSWCDGRGLCALVHHYQPALLPLADVEPVTTLTSQAERSAALDDSLDFSYGQLKMDSEQYSAVLENEKKNFRLLINKVLEFVLLQPWLFFREERTLNL